MGDGAVREGGLSEGYIPDKGVKGQLCLLHRP